MNNPDSLTPKAGIDAIELHVRSYRSALKSTLEVTVNSLTNSHIRMDSILHPYGQNLDQLDTSAFIYSVFRLPSAIDKTEKVIIGQNPEVFTQNGFANVDDWPRVNSPGRRRPTYFNDNTKVMASFAASISDIDDLTNILIAYQTEWNKFHLILHHLYKNYPALKKDIGSTDFLNKLNIPYIDWLSLKTALGPNWKIRLKRVYYKTINLRLRLLAGSWLDYTKTAQQWWHNISETIGQKYDLENLDIYFVSSNTHSLLNLYTGFALKHKKLIIDHIKNYHPDLYKIWISIENKEHYLNPNDFLYFAFKSFVNEPKIKIEFEKFQRKLGIITIPNSPYLDVHLQIFPIKNLIKSKFIDPRLKIHRPNKIKNSKALIFNIDYPLGFAAYHILSETMENVGHVKGVYLLGKAAVLNSELGDIQIPRVVFDEHSQNTYMFNNCFNSFFPFPNNQGSILTNQKSVSVLGTFLENGALLDTYSKNNLTIVEMESGPYLSAITEATYDQQNPRSTVVDLNSCPIDIGIINYTSDTPYSQAKNLASHKLSITGVEPTYLGSLTILQRIIEQEEKDK